MRRSNLSPICRGHHYRIWGSRPIRTMDGCYRLHDCGERGKLWCDHLLCSMVSESERCLFSPQRPFVSFFPFQLWITALKSHNVTNFYAMRSADFAKCCWAKDDVTCGCRFGCGRLGLDSDECPTYIHNGRLLSCSCFLLHSQSILGTLRRILRKGATSMNYC